MDTTQVMQTIDSKIRELEELKSQLLRSANSQLPENVSLIYTGHLHELRVPRGDWGDAQKETAWIKCHSCNVHYFTHRSPNQRSGKYYETDTKCPVCGSSN
mmetsp:Transcript_9844/g.17833  ORF Transcript_9844/g.17833 Transcript_9844/m.17833 type:complete len:101 (+) Transcript_9844:101-403(+)